MQAQNKKETKPSKADWQRLYDAALRFRGIKSWEWLADSKQEASLFALILEQATEVALKLKQEPNFIMGPTDLHYLVRVPRVTKRAIEWRNEYLVPEAPGREPIRYRPQSVDEVKIKRISKKARKIDIALEVDYAYMYAPVQEGNRPFYPYAILWVDHNTGFALHVAVTKPDRLEQVFSKELLEVFLKRALIPAQILVKREDLFRMPIPYSERLGFEIVLVDELPLIEEAQRELGEHLLGE